MPRKRALPTHNEVSQPEIPVISTKAPPRSRHDRTPSPNSSSSSSRDSTAGSLKETPLSISDRKPHLSRHSSKETSSTSQDPWLRPTENISSSSSFSPAEKASDPAEHDDLSPDATRTSKSPKPPRVLPPSGNSADHRQSTDLTSADASASGVSIAESVVESGASVPLTSPPAPLSGSPASTSTTGSTSDTALTSEASKSSPTTDSSANNQDVATDSSIASSTMAPLIFSPAIDGTTGLSPLSVITDHAPVLPITSLPAASSRTSTVNIPVTGLWTSSFTTMTRPKTSPLSSEPTAVSGSVDAPVEPGNTTASYNDSSDTMRKETPLALENGRPTTMLTTMLDPLRSSRSTEARDSVGSATTKSSLDTADDTRTAGLKPVVPTTSSGRPIASDSDRAIEADKSMSSSAQEDGSNKTTLDGINSESTEPISGPTPAAPFLPFVTSGFITSVLSGPRQSSSSMTSSDSTMSSQTSSTRLTGHTGSDIERSGTPDVPDGWQVKDTTGSSEPAANRTFDVSNGEKDVESAASRTSRSLHVTEVLDTTRESLFAMSSTLAPVESGTFGWKHDANDVEREDPRSSSKQPKTDGETDSRSSITALDVSSSGFVTTTSDPQGRLTVTPAPTGASGIASSTSSTSPAATPPLTPTRFRASDDALASAGPETFTDLDSSERSGKFTGVEPQPYTRLGFPDGADDARSRTDLGSTAGSADGGEVEGSRVPGPHRSNVPSNAESQPGSMPNGTSDAVESQSNPGPPTGSVDHTGLKDSQASDSQRNAPTSSIESRPTSRPETPDGTSDDALSRTNLGSSTGSVDDVDNGDSQASGSERIKKPTSVDSHPDKTSDSASSRTGPPVSSVAHTESGDSQASGSDRTKMPASVDSQPDKTSDNASSQTGPVTSASPATDGSSVKVEDSQASGSDRSNAAATSGSQRDTKSSLPVPTPQRLTAPPPASAETHASDSGGVTEQLKSSETSRLNSAQSPGATSVNGGSEVNSEATKEHLTGSSEDGGASSRETSSSAPEPARPTSGASPHPEPEDSALLQTSQGSTVPSSGASSDKVGSSPTGEPASSTGKERDETAVPSGSDNSSSRTPSSSQTGNASDEALKKPGSDLVDSSSHERGTPLQTSSTGSVTSGSDGLAGTAQFSEATASSTTDPNFGSEVPSGVPLKAASGASAESQTTGDTQVSTSSLVSPNVASTSAAANQSQSHDADGTNGSSSHAEISSQPVGDGSSEADKSHITSSAVVGSGSAVASSSHPSNSGTRQHLDASGSTTETAPNAQTGTNMASDDRPSQTKPVAVSTSGTSSGSQSSKDSADDAVLPTSTASDTSDNLRASTDSSRSGETRVAVESHATAHPQIPAHIQSSGSSEQNQVQSEVPIAPHTGSPRPAESGASSSTASTDSQASASSDASSGTTTPDHSHASGSPQDSAGSHASAPSSAALSSASDPSQTSTEGTDANQSRISSDSQDSPKSSKLDSHMDSAASSSSRTSDDSQTASPNVSSPITAPVHPTASGDSTRPQTSGDAPDGIPSRISTSSQASEIGSSNDSRASAASETSDDSHAASSHDSSSLNVSVRPTASGDSSSDNSPASHDSPSSTGSSHSSTSHSSPDSQAPADSNASAGSPDMSTTSDTLTTSSASVPAGSQTTLDDTQHSDDSLATFGSSSSLASSSIVSVDSVSSISSTSASSSNTAQPVASNDSFNSSISSILSSNPTFTDSSSPAGPLGTAPGDASHDSHASSTSSLESSSSAVASDAAVTDSSSQAETPATSHDDSSHDSQASSASSPDSDPAVAASKSSSTDSPSPAGSLESAQPGTSLDSHGKGASSVSSPFSSPTAEFLKSPDSHDIADHQATTSSNAATGSDTAAGTHDSATSQHPGSAVGGTPSSSSSAPEDSISDVAHPAHEASSTRNLLGSSQQPNETGSVTRSGASTDSQPAKTNLPGLMASSASDVAPDAFTTSASISSTPKETEEMESKATSASNTGTSLESEQHPDGTEASNGSGTSTDSQPAQTDLPGSMTSKASDVSAGSISGSASRTRPSPERSQQLNGTEAATGSDASANSQPAQTDLSVPMKPTASGVSTNSTTDSGSISSPEAIGAKATSTADVSSLLNKHDGDDASTTSSGLPNSDTQTSEASSSGSTMPVQSGGVVDHSGSTSSVSASQATSTADASSRLNKHDGDGGDDGSTTKSGLSTGFDTQTSSASSSSLETPSKSGDSPDQTRSTSSVIASNDAGVDNSDASSHSDSSANSSFLKQGESSTLRASTEQVASPDQTTGFMSPATPGTTAIAATGAPAKQAESATPKTSADGVASPDQTNSFALTGSTEGASAVATGTQAGEHGGSASSADAQPPTSTAGSESRILPVTQLRGATSVTRYDGVDSSVDSTSTDGLQTASSVISSKASALPSRVTAFTSGVVSSPEDTSSAVVDGKSSGYEGPGTSTGSGIDAVLKGTKTGSPNLTTSFVSATVFSGAIHPPDATPVAGYDAQTSSSSVAFPGTRSQSWTTLLRSSTAATAKTTVPSEVLAKSSSGADLAATSGSSSVPGSHTGPKDATNPEGTSASVGQSSNDKDLAGSTSTTFATSLRTSRPGVGVSSGSSPQESRGPDEVDSGMSSGGLSEASSSTTPSFPPVGSTRFSKVVHSSSVDAMDRTTSVKSETLTSAAGSVNGSSTSLEEAALSTDDSSNVKDKSSSDGVVPDSEDKPTRTSVEEATTSAGDVTDMKTGSSPIEAQTSTGSLDGSSMQHAATGTAASVKSPIKPWAEETMTGPTRTAKPEAIATVSGATTRPAESAKEDDATRATVDGGRASDTNLISSSHPAGVNEQPPAPTTAVSDGSDDGSHTSGRASKAEASKDKSKSTSLPNGRDDQDSSASSSKISDDSGISDGSHASITDDGTDSSKSFSSSVPLPTAMNEKAPSALTTDFTGGSGTSGSSEAGAATTLDGSHGSGTGSGSSTSSGSATGLDEQSSDSASESGGMASVSETSVGAEPAVNTGKPPAASESTGLAASSQSGGSSRNSDLSGSKTLFTSSSASASRITPGPDASDGSSRGSKASDSEGLSTSGSASTSHIPLGPEAFDDLSHSSDVSASETSFASNEASSSPAALDSETSGVDRPSRTSASVAGLHDGDERSKAPGSRPTSIAGSDARGSTLIDSGTGLTSDSSLPTPKIPLGSESSGDDSPSRTSTSAASVQDGKEESKDAGTATTSILGTGVVPLTTSGPVTAGFGIPDADARNSQRLEAVKSTSSSWDQTSKETAPPTATGLRDNVIKGSTTSKMPLALATDSASSDGKDGASRFPGLQSGDIPPTSDDLPTRVVTGEDEQRLSTSDKLSKETLKSDGLSREGEVSGPWTATVTDPSKGTQFSEWTSPGFTTLPKSDFIASTASTENLIPESSGTVSSGADGKPRLGSSSPVPHPVSKKPSSVPGFEPKTSTEVEGPPSEKLIAQSSSTVSSEIDGEGHLVKNSGSVSKTTSSLPGSEPKTLAEVTGDSRISVTASSPDAARSTDLHPEPSGVVSSPKTASATEVMQSTSGAHRTSSVHDTSDPQVHDTLQGHGESQGFPVASVSHSEPWGVHHDSGSAAELLTSTGSSKSASSTPQPSVADSTALGPKATSARDDTKDRSCREKANISGVVNSNVSCIDRNTGHVAISSDPDTESIESETQGMLRPSHFDEWDSASSTSVASALTERPSTSAKTSEFDSESGDGESFSSDFETHDRLRSSPFDEWDSVYSTRTSSATTSTDHVFTSSDSDPENLEREPLSSGVENLSMPRPSASDERDSEQDSGDSEAFSTSRLKDFTPSPVRTPDQDVEIIGPGFDDTSKSERISLSNVESFDPSRSTEVTLPISASKTSSHPSDMTRPESPGSGIREADVTSGPQGSRVSSSSLRMLEPIGSVTDFGVPASKQTSSHPVTATESLDPSHGAEVTLADPTLGTSFSSPSEMTKSQSPGAGVEKDDVTTAAAESPSRVPPESAKDRESVSDFDVTTQKHASASTTTRTAGVENPDSSVDDVGGFDFRRRVRFFNETPEDCWFHVFLFRASIDIAADFKSSGFNLRNWLELFNME
ncbi:hypothetical protein CP532_1540 [Ophiocordyceps camponoti-leonardi (nom. inval.)]|nr:hypothetical protein CP532_1540 [Ophiocordyceps camponoti-leonardi (nom. inval.)]